MNLEWSGLTLASHLSLSLSVIFVLINAVVLRRRWPVNGPFYLLEALELPCFALGASLIVERSYYVAARLLEPSGINLWKAHPAPEVLSLMIGLSLLWLAIEIGRIARWSRAIRMMLMMQCTSFATVTAGIGWALW